MYSIIAQPYRNIYFSYSGWTSFTFITLWTMSWMCDGVEKCVLPMYLKAQREQIYSCFYYSIYYIGMLSYNKVTRCMLSGTVATVKYPSDHDNCGKSCNCLDFGTKISLYTLCQLQKVIIINVSDVIFWNSLLLCCVLFCLSAPSCKE